MSLNKIIKFPTIDSKKNLFFLAIFYYGIFFLPIILYAYFYCDDKILIYSTYSEIKFYDGNFFEICVDSFKGFFQLGRFYGLYLTHYIIYYFFHDRLSYYIVKSLFNLISVLSFAWFLKVLTKNSDNYKAFIFLMPIMFIIITIVDPLASMGLSTQYSAISIALASGFYILWHENKSKKYFFLTWIFFIWSFFHYEIGVCIVPIFIVLAVRIKLKSQELKADLSLIKKIGKYSLLSIQVCFKELKFFLIPFFLWVAICIYLHASKADVYDGIDINFNLERFLLSWIVQIITSLPFGAFHKELYLVELNFERIFSATILFISAYFIFLKVIPKINLKNNYRDVVLIGFILILVPSGMISLSYKYQTWVLGNIYEVAFIQIFLQFFGMGFLLIAYISYILNNSRLYLSQMRQKIVIHFVVTACSISIALINIFNYNAIEQKNYYEGQNFVKIFLKAMKNGVVQDFPIEESASENLKKINDRYGMAFEKLFEKDSYKKDPKIKEDFKDLNVFHFYIQEVYTSHFLSYVNKSHGLLVQNYFHPDDEKYFRKNIKLTNSYYADPWLYNIYDGKNNKNHSGFIIAGKLDRIGYACDKVQSKSNQNCYRIMNVLSPKIFIDKEYLFKLKVIIETLNKAFGENIFKDSFEKIEENLKNSQDGILIKLDNKIYKIKRP